MQMQRDSMTTGDFPADGLRSLSPRARGPLTRNGLQVLTVTLQLGLAAAAWASSPGQAAHPPDEGPPAASSDGTAEQEQRNRGGATVRLAEQQDRAEGWRDLFDGRSLDGWKSANFGGEGDVTVEDGRIVLGFGAPLTGIVATGANIPRSDYELLVEARREDGTDFFCALTFPVQESHASFVAGGWGGSVVGISSIDGEDASENNTTTYRAFQRGQWYTLRVRVTGERLQAWIDQDQVVNEEIRGHEISTRPEVDVCKPLGIAAFDTQSGIRKIRLRALPAK
jgi:hypothetical protein